MSRAAALYYSRKRRRQVLGAEANSALFASPATVGTTSANSVTLLGNVYLALRSDVDVTAGSLSVTDGSSEWFVPAGSADTILPLGFFRKGTSLFFGETPSGNLEILARRYHDEFQAIGTGDFTP